MAQNVEKILSRKKTQQTVKSVPANLDSRTEQHRKSTITRVPFNGVSIDSEREKTKIDSHDNSLNLLMSDLSQLSKSFVSSCENLEGQVEHLNGQLENASVQRSEAIEETQKLMGEKKTINNRLQNLLAILPSGVVVIDGKGVVRECNEVAISILGRPLLGESWLTVIRRTFLPQEDDGHQISLKDGRKVHIETRALDSEPGQIVVLTDMTKTRQLQSELSQQQKLSSMGKMIASLAHQIRTPLSAALLYGSHLSSGKLPTNKQSEFSRQLLERLQFMDRQITDMLDFVKGERKEKQAINIGRLIDLIRSFTSTLSHPINFLEEKNITENYKIVADIDSLVGAIINLVNNAVDATENGELIDICFSTTKNKKLLIEIIDRGVGISEIQLKKIFEPFYSTKTQGNGLGLAIVHGTVIEHNGIISVDSKLACGSIFKIELPIFENNISQSEKQFHSIGTTSESRMNSISNQRI